MSAQNMQQKSSIPNIDIIPEANTTHINDRGFLADIPETKGMEWWQSDRFDFEEIFNRSIKNSKPLPAKIKIHNS